MFLICCTNEDGKLKNYDNNYHNTEIMQKRIDYDKKIKKKLNEFSTHKKILIKENKIIKTYNNKEHYKLEKRKYNFLTEDNNNIPNIIMKTDFNDDFNEIIQICRDTSRIKIFPNMEDFLKKNYNFSQGMSEVIKMPLECIIALDDFYTLLWEKKIRGVNNYYEIDHKASLKDFVKTDSGQWKLIDFGGIDDEVKGNIMQNKIEFLKNNNVPEYTDIKIIGSMKYLEKLEKKNKKRYDYARLFEFIDK